MQSQNPTTEAANIRDVMGRFKRGFGRVDRDALASAITADFEWHMHWQEDTGDAPTGKVLRGLDEVMAEIERRRDTWSDVRFDNVQERYLDDIVLQTFVVSGIDERGRRFASEAVDLYPIRDGLLARKQTYWKQMPHDA